MMWFLLFLFQTNTYQVVVITDGAESYAVLTYQCGAMTWHGNATTGFNAGGTWFENHPLSRTVNSNTIACTNNSQTVWTNLVYKLTPRGECVHHNITALTPFLCLHHSDPLPVVPTLQQCHR